MMSRILGRILVAGCTVLLAGIAGAPPAAQAGVITTGCTGNPNVSCTIGELFGGGTIQVGDKLFTNWTGITNQVLNTRGVSGFFITVSGVETDPNAPGIRMTSTNGSAIFVGGWDIPILAGARATLLHEFSYDVVVQGTDLIEDNTMDLAVATFIDGGAGASIQVTEVVKDLTETTTLATKVVTQDDLSVSATYSSTLSAVRVFTSVSLSVENTSNSTVAIDSVTQTFSQIPGAGGGSDIPEPATFAIFGLGLAGIGFARRRKRA